MASRVSGSDARAPDTVVPPIVFERRRKAAMRKQARIDEAGTSDFADKVQGYAYLHGHDAGQVLADEQAARAAGKPGSPGLKDYLDGSTIEPTDAPAAPKAGLSLRGKASKAGTKTLGASNAAGKAAGGSYAKPLTVRAAGGLGVQAGGFLLGAMGYALAINYVRYGLPGVKAFVKAKATNKVTPLDQLGKGASAPLPAKANPVRAA